jgi:hypothetical protein
LSGGRWGEGSKCRGGGEGVRGKGKSVSGGGVRRKKKEANAEEERGTRSEAKDKGGAGIRCRCKMRRRRCTLRYESRALKNETKWALTFRRLKTPWKCLSRSFFLLAMSVAALLMRTSATSSECEWNATVASCCGLVADCSWGSLKRNRSSE